MTRNNNYIRTVNFRRWTRKSFAIFNSLHIVIKICVVSVAYSLLRPCQPATAQVDSSKISKTTELEEIEVSGQREPVIASQVSRIVTVISKNEIEQAPYINVNDLLRLVPQVDIHQRGPNGAQADISIEGGTFDETLILLNGINITNPQTGHYNLVLPLDIESIGRVEVLKGPASRVYGTNAFCGAVNFITGLDTVNYAKASLTGGDFGLWRESLTANLHSNHFTNFISVSEGKSDGYIYNTDYKYGNLYYTGKAIYNQGSLAIQTGYTDNAYGANNFYAVSAESNNQFDHTTTYFGSITGETGKVLKTKPYLYWHRNYDHYEFIRQDPGVYQNFHFTDVYGAGINSTYFNQLGKTSLGIDYRNEIIHSTNLGLTTPDSIRVANENIYYDKMASRYNLSFFAEHVVNISNLSVALGIMANYNSKIGGIKFYPGSDISYKLNKIVKVYTSVNNSLRLPTFTDLYYNGPQAKGNSTLQPEQAWTFESGLKFINGAYSGNITYFNRWGKNIIDWVLAPNSGGTWNAIQYPSLITSGVEIAGNIFPQYVFGKDYFIEQIHLSYSFTSLSKSADSIRSNYALDNLRYKFVIQVNHRIIKNLEASWQFSYQKRNGNYGQYNANSNPAWTILPYNPFMLLDGKISYKFKFIKIFAEATNILNQKYFDMGNIPQPGRWFKAGLEVCIK